MTKAIQFNTAEQCIHDRFDRIASIIPDNHAVSDKDNILTYHDLERLSNKMAHCIIGTLGNGNGNIALMFENNVLLAIGILGILKSGRSYVPLDTSFPIERKKFIIGDADCKMIICTAETSKYANSIADGIYVLAADKMPSGIPESTPQTASLPGSNAVTLYTSGSTGEPKGVLQSHQNLVHFVKRMTDQYPIYPQDKAICYLSPAFSAHALSFLGALLCGATLVMQDFRNGNFLGFSKWMKETEISFAMMIPSFLRHFLAVQEKQDRYPHLRILMLAGETLYRSDVEKAKKVFHPSIEMVNLYASTEGYMMRSFSIKKDTIIKTNIVPIGYPVDGMNLSLIGKDNKQPGPKESGEIILSSKFVSEGYWRRPSLQETNFSLDSNDNSIRIFKTSDIAYYLEDDCLVHTGRKDSVVKLRGYRIDFDEIINILLQNSEVMEAACTLKEDSSGTEHIIAYVVPSSSRGYDPEIVRAMLVRLLPDYMTPSYIIEISELPKNDSGKLDTKSLPDQEWIHGSVHKEKPADEIESALVDIFEKVLKISPIGTNENFLKIGANSLGLFVAFSEVEKKFKIKIDVKTTIDNPNIQSLATLIHKH